MYRIRIHGRGGQGIKMASRILGTALFRSGYTVQDAPKYGAERRGAPIFSYVRAAHQAINERGVIQQPDLVVVADDTLLAVPAAGTLQGIGPETVVLINSHQSADTWRHRLNLRAKVEMLEGENQRLQDKLQSEDFLNGAMAVLLGVIITLVAPRLMPKRRRNSEWA